MVTTALVSTSMNPAPKKKSCTLSALTRPPVLKRSPDRMGADIFGLGENKRISNRPNPPIISIPRQLKVGIIGSRKYRKGQSSVALRSPPSGASTLAKPNCCHLGVGDGWLPNDCSGNGPG